MLKMKKHVNKPKKQNIIEKRTSQYYKGTSVKFVKFGEKTNENGKKEEGVRDFNDGTVIEYEIMLVRIKTTILIALNVTINNERRW